MNHPSAPRKTIVMTLDKLIFRSEDSDAVIFSGKDDSGKIRQVVGTLANPKVGSIVKASGIWKHHEKYGWQFKAAEVSILSADPSTDTREGLQCKVTFVKELKAETGFCSASGLMEDGSKVRLSGRLRNMSPGSEVFALGEWHEDAQFGKEYRVRQWEYSRAQRPGALQRCHEMLVAIRKSQDGSSRTVEFQWDEVQLRDNSVEVPYPKGQTTICSMSGARESYNSIKSYLADRLPALQVSFDSKGIGCVLNSGVIRDAVTLMHVTHTLRYGKMETREKNRDIMDVVSGMSPEATKVFVPRDVTMYLDFLQERQSEFFNVVPIEEYNGGSREHAFLFTIMIADRTCIVWESTNPSRATFVFPCTDEDYSDRLQTVCSFIADERAGKRQYMHSAASAVTFGEKPILLAHNTFDSWSARLLSAV